MKLHSYLKSVNSLNDIFRVVAERKGLTRYQVEDIFKSQFSFITKAMKELKAVRLPSFGVFRPIEKYNNDEGKSTTGGE